MYKSQVGAACESGDQCLTEECFTREYLEETVAELGGEWTYDIPGGMCSKLFCMNNGQCGESGYCFDVGPLFDAPIPIGLCLLYCETDADCRTDEGYSCYFTGVEGQRSCLPESLVSEIPCGDGVCSEEDSESSETCPRDCP